jgi:enoyl-CoA hydratase/carnithine racemase
VIVGNEELITRCFDNKESVQDIVHSLAMEAGRGSEWAKETLGQFQRASPTSLVLSFAQLTRGKRLKTLGDCLKMEFRIMMNCMRDDADFREGVRALIIEKDNAPKWKPDRVEDVSIATIERYFDSLGEHDLDFYQL